MKLLFLALALSGCATVKLAETQCGAKQELQAAAWKVAAVEAQALVCNAAGTSVEACEEAAGATLASSAVAGSAREANDVLRCAAALIADAGHAKTVTPTKGTP